MSSRIALAGPFQTIRAKAIDEAANVAPFLEKLQRLNVPDLWYSSVIQAGVEKLELSNTWGQDTSLSPFVQKRVVQEKTPEFGSIFSLIEAAFPNHVGESTEKNEPVSLIKLKSFLVELLLAAHRKRNLLVFDRIPDIGSLDGNILPADLLLPFRNLIMTLESSSPSLASTKQSLALQDIALFEEIMASKLFRQYEHSHSYMDENDVPIQEALESVQSGSRLLVSQSPRLLRTKRVTVSLLPITSKIIDVVFGKLPGSLAEFFTTALTKWLQENRRVVIYQFDDLLEVTMKARMMELTGKMPLDSK